MLKKFDANQKFGSVLLIILMSSAFYFDPGHLYSTLIFAFSGLLFLAVLLFSQAITPLRIVFEKLGYVLGVINTYLLLTIIYILLFLPIGTALKIFRKDVLGINRDPKTDTYWQSKEIENSMKHQF